MSNKRNPFAIMFQVLIILEILLIFGLAALKGALSPEFQNTLQNIALGDVLAILISIFFYQLFFPDDLQDKNENTNDKNKTPNQK